MASKYKRILLKISGQIIAGEKDFGFSKSALHHLRDEIKDAYNSNVEIGIVIGGGNIFRGKEAVESFSAERVSADYMGMIATLINALLLQNILEEQNIPTRVMSAINVAELAEPFIRRKALRHLEKRRIVIFACGTGNPFFTTDTAAVLRAIETESEAILKGTKVQGIYDKDPEKFKDAKFFRKLTYNHVIEKRLKVMDTTAFSLAMENNLPILVFNILKRGSLCKILSGNNIGTIVSDEV
ncbi:MAG: UMP kinase [Candidatus Cloacimonadota bacterium]|nr:MAG: UMP kinase [Candidatus Cloacimonadota bacterium]